MSNLRLHFTFLIFGFFLLAGSHSYATGLGIVNNTGYDLHEFYVRLNDSLGPAWSDNLIPSNEVFVNEGQHAFSLQDIDNLYGMWSVTVRAIDSEGNIYEKYVGHLGFIEYEEGNTLTSADITRYAANTNTGGGKGKPVKNSFSGYINITNDTGYDIYYLHFSHEDTTDWEEDMLGDDILEDGETFQITVTDYASSIFDFRAQDEDGDTYTIYGIDIATNDLVLTLDHLDDQSSGGNGFDGYINITNRTGYDIYYLHVSHEDETSWEEDMLGDDILEHGETFEVTVTDYASSIFDIRAQDEDGDTYTVYGIDIATDDLVLTLDYLDD